MRERQRGDGYPIGKYYRTIDLGPRLTRGRVGQQDISSALETSYSVAYPVVKLVVHPHTSGRNIGQKGTFDVPVVMPWRPNVKLP